MQAGGYRRGPWYRGGVPRSYAAPTVFASMGCAICLASFSVIFLIAGGAMFGISRFAKKRENEPPFDTEFFKKNRSNIPDIVGTIGSVILGIGCTMLVIAIVVCAVAGRLARNQERNKHTEQQNPLTTATSYPPPPPSAYPHQPPSQNVYPPPGTYPSQPVCSSIPTQGQYQYPAQPAGYYPPPYSGAPQPTGNQYPPTSYAQPAAPNAPAQDVGDIEKQPL